jgi:hypothetical protein
MESHCRRQIRGVRGKKRATAKRPAAPRAAVPAAKKTAARKTPGRKTPARKAVPVTSAGPKRKPTATARPATRKTRA